MSGTTTAAQQGQAAKQDLLSRLHGKKAQTDAYDVVLDPAPIEALATAQRKLQYAKTFEGENVVAAELAVAEAEAAARDVVVTLHFYGLGRPHYERLLLAHPPTAKQKEDGQTYDDATFAPALVAATVLEHEGSGRSVTDAEMDAFIKTGEPLPGRAFRREDVAALFAEWNLGEVSQVYAKAIGVCTLARNANLPKGSGTTRA